MGDKHIFFLFALESYDTLLRFSIAIFDYVPKHWLI
jgi:hypothetical protein